MVVRVMEKLVSRRRSRRASTGVGDEIDGPPVYLRAIALEPIDALILFLRRSDVASFSVARYAGVELHLPLSACASADSFDDRRIFCFSAFFDLVARW